MPEFPASGIEVRQNQTATIALGENATYEVLEFSLDYALRNGSTVFTAEGRIAVTDPDAGISVVRHCECESFADLVAELGEEQVNALLGAHGTLVKTFIK